MPQVKQVGALQIGEDIPQQHRFWKVERAGWLIFLILLVLAALGFAGGKGPLNEATASNGQIEVSYEPYARRVAPSTIDITLKQLGGATAQLLVQRDFIDEYEIRSITPEPSDTKATEDMLVYSFSVPEGATSLDITFSLEPEATNIGAISGRLGPAADALVTIKQVVYP